MIKMRHFAPAFIMLLASVCGVIPAFGQDVVVNEFCTANYTDWAPGGGTQYEDWIELYNTTAAPVNISGFWLSDDVSDPQKWQFPAGSIVPANDYLIVLISGTSDYDPNYLGFLNTSFRVTQTNGDDIVFANAGGTVLESFDLGTLGAFQANHSYGRTTDGGASWGIFSNPTQDGANTGSVYASYTSRPELSVQAGYQSAPISVSISSDPGATIYYTLDGSEPDNTDTPYAGPINVSTTTSVRAIAYSPDPQVLPSLIETNTYFFGADQHSVMVVNISGSTLSDGSWGWAGGAGELTHIEFFYPLGGFMVEATGDSNEHGNDSNAYDQRGFDYITRDAMGYDNVIDHPLFGTSDRPSYERIIFKAAANDNYPESNGGAHIRDAYVHHLSVLGGLQLDERKTESCIVYINGEYWGVYEIREKVDDIDFTEYYYDQPDGFVDFIKTWGGTWEEYGSEDDWVALVDFITSNDMTDQANYDYVLTQYNTISLIDYFILNGYTVCTDWLNWNTAWWRGRHPNGEAKRWRYALWDNDATFDHYVNYTGVPSTNPDADPCQIDDMGDVGGQGHVPVLNALFDNENFLADYVQRYAALSNSIFSCETMIEVLDSMIAVIEPEMERHCSRWGGTFAGWQSNVQDMRDFILNRCNSTIIGGIEECYDVTAYNVTLEIDGVGELTLESLPMNNSNTPFTGVFFADLPIDLDALSEGSGCGSFVGWEITSGTGEIAEPGNPQTTLVISSDVTLVAHFSEPSVGPITVVTDLSIPGAGVIEVNGAGQGSYPYSTVQNGGDFLSLSTTPNEWFTFDHWESAHSVLDPDNEALAVTLNPCVSDTIIAVYEAIDHFTLDVSIGDEGGGVVVFNGDTLPLDGVTLDLLGGDEFTFTALPFDEWSVFDHWEIEGNTVSPDDLSYSIILTLIENGSLTAVFTVIPHHTVTVVVDPPYAGTVVFGEEHISGVSFVTDYTKTVVLEGEKIMPFEAMPADFYEFTSWSARYHDPVPDAEQKNVSYTFQSSDTIWAHFEKEPFSIYIPNSFSPNNDGTNDVFRAYGNAVDPESYHMMIFNRWGEKVFESRDINKVWEGDMGGGQYYVSNESYQYLLKVKSVHDPKPREYSGSILVFR